MAHAHLERARLVIVVAPAHPRTRAPVTRWLTAPSTGYIPSPSKELSPMGVSLPGTLVRTGEERATLVRRTYGLVFISVIVTTLGVGFAFTQPALMQAVARHPIITMLAMFAPLWMAMQARHQFPKNLILTLLFTFIEGICHAPFLFMAERNHPGIVGQAGLLTLSTFGVLSLYAVVSKRDFSAWGSFFIVGL